MRLDRKPNPHIAFGSGLHKDSEWFCRLKEAANLDIQVRIAYNKMVDIVDLVDIFNIMPVTENNTMSVNPARAVSQLGRYADRLRFIRSTRERLLRAQRLKIQIDELGQRLEAIVSMPDPVEEGMRIVRELQAAEGGPLSGAALQAKFGLSSAVLHRRRAEHRIIYWRDAKHDFYYPKWQFTATGALLPGIQEILQMFNSQDEWRIMRYFLGPRQQLGNRRPIDLIRTGKIERVLTHAREHAEENTW